MSSNKMLQIDLLILYLLTILSEVFASPIKTDSNSTYDLERRECKYNPRTDHYDICDFKLPTLAQIVARLHDTNNYGKVTPERSAVFYTNLDDPKLKSGENVQLAWLHGWLKKENVRYYWYADSLDPVCKCCTQPRLIIVGLTDFRVFRPGQVDQVPRARVLARLARQRSQPFRRV